MTLEQLNTLAALGTLVVFAATAVAGLVQIRHPRASNELDALIHLSEALRGPDLRDAFRYVQTELESKLADPSYRAELSRIGFVDARAHPEMEACNWFDEIGALVKHRLVDERTFLDLFARLVVFYWAHLEGVVALMRRERGAAQYANFEYLAVLAERWLAKHPAGEFPGGIARKPVRDPWREIDGTA